MEITINKEELKNRNEFDDSITLYAIYKHIEGFGESDYKHISAGILKILSDENIIKDKTN